MDLISAEVLALVIWGWFILYLLLGDDALPGGPIFPLTALFVCSVLASCVSWIKLAGAKVPSLLGMIIVGAVMRNVGAIDSLENSWSSAIRKIALAIILTRAGLVMSVEAVKKLGRPTVMLATFPVLSEAIVVSVMTRFLLTGPQMSWSWCFMMGFIVAAVSPAVIVPVLTDLQQRGVGLSKGVPSMILCAAGFDAVVAVTGFGIAFGISFASNLAMSVAQGPIDIAVGLSAPLAIGFFYAKVLLLDVFNLGFNFFFQVIILLLMGTSFVIGFGEIGYTGGGALAAMLMGAVIQYFGAEKKELLEEMGAVYAVVWERAAKPLLFVLIGAAIDMGTLDAEVVGIGIGIIAIGLSVRLPMVVACMSRTNLTAKERAFVAIAWLPKATVQAALGSLALDEVKEMSPEPENEKKWGERILAVSVLAILCTAPLGAVLVEVWALCWFFFFWVSLR